MITRIGAVIVCILSAIWLARTPDWEPLIALITGFGGYLALEFTQGHKKKDDQDRSHKEKKGKIGSKEEESIITHIAIHGAKESQELAAEMGISKIRSEYLCDQLYKKGFIEYPAAWINRCPYYLTEKAREYLITKGIIK